MGTRIVVSDIQESFHFVKFKPRENHMVIFADDVNPRYLFVVVSFVLHALSGIQQVPVAGAEGGGGGMGKSISENRRRPSGAAIGNTDGEFSLRYACWDSNFWIAVFSWNGFVKFRKSFASTEKSSRSDVAEAEDYPAFRFPPPPEMDVSPPHGYLHINTFIYLDGERQRSDAYLNYGSIITLWIVPYLQGKRP